MRYRIGESPEAPGPSPDQSALTATAVLSLLIGIGFMIAGIRSRHYWMAVWGTGLSLCSAAYLAFVGGLLN
ncbi:MAG: hypothetical protein PVF08_07270 [Gammaproteobacteria bacterium]|jgi:hypothetical protein